MFRKFLFSMVLLAMGFTTSALAQETLTVYDGNATNNYVPIYGLYVDSYCKAEIVMNADQLTDMTGGTISGLTWYLQNPAAAAWTGAVFQIFMKEVPDATIQSYWGLDGATVVYEGALDGTQSELPIEFTTPYTYEGGHLLIGVYVTQKGTYKSASFQGETVTDAAINGYTSTALDDLTTGTVRSFIPKTTFEYVPSGGTVYPKPSNLQVSEITANSAKVSWNAGSDESVWNVEYKKSADEEWIAAATPSNPFVTLDVLENGTPYNVRVRSVYPENNFSAWVSTSFTTMVCDAEDMGEVAYTLTDTYGDGWNNNKLQIVYHKTGALVTELSMSQGNLSEGTINLCYGEEYDLIWVPANYGYECGFTLTAPDGTVIYEHHGNGSSGSEPAAGNLTTFTISKVTCPRPTALTASNVVYNGATLTWTAGDEDQDLWQVVYGTGDFDPNTAEPISVNGEPTLQLTGLQENTTYQAYVRSACSSEDMSTWSEVCTFTTPLQFAIPTDLHVDNITAKSADATWTGEAESYNLRYRTKAGNEKFYEESFEGEITWRVHDADGDGNNWGVIRPAQYTMSGVPLEAKDGEYCLLSQSYLSGALTPDNWAISPQIALNGTLEFWLADDGNYPETIRVYASTTDDAIASFQAISEDIVTQAPGTPNQWVKYEIDLSAFNGQQGYLAFRHYNSEDNDIIFLDAIALNGAAIPEGEWVVMEGVTSPVTMEPLTAGTTYEVQVQGVYADGNSDWNAITEFTTLPADAMPTGLEVTAVTATTADVNWTGVQEAYNLRYRTPASADVKFFESFEEGLGNWTVIDSDGDGNNWTQFNPMNFSSGGFPAYDGTYGAMSRSWMSNSALTPDNWLISPQVELGTTLRYYIVDDGSNYEETYRIYISTTDNNIESFVPLTDDMLSPNSTDWTEVNIDLSAYAGQMGYIAFRQYNCTDRDFMIIDAISILGDEVAAGEWVEVENVTAPYTITGLAPETTYEVEVQGIVDENTVTDWTAPVAFTTLGGVRGDADGNGRCDMDDLSALINYLLNDSSPINQAGAAICDSLESTTVDMDDLSALINYLLTNSWGDE